MNIPTDWDAVWTAVAMHMIAAPNQSARRRPIPSDKYGANGYPASAPMFYIRRNRSATADYIAEGAHLYSIE